MKLRDSVVVVTGASAGIGRATAERLARRGARVWAVARSETALKELAREHPTVVPFVADLSSADERAALVDAVGPVDILINNAGIGWTGIVEDMPHDEVRRLFELNVLALVDLTQQVLPGMLERRRGHVCNVASIASFVSTPPFTVYSATKFAVQGFSDGLRREMRGRGVVVTTVNPGPVRTMFAKRAARGDRPTEELGTSHMVGVSPGLVAFAIERAIRMNGIPWWSTISVPRLMGLSRLGALPVVHLVVEAAALASRHAVPRGRAR